MTGLSNMLPEQSGKLLDLLKKLLPESLESRSFGILPIRARCSN